MTLIDDLHAAWNTHDPKGVAACYAEDGVREEFLITHARVQGRDGVVTVPRARIEETLKNLERVKAIEAATLERVRGGLKELPVEVPALKRMGRG